MPKKLYDEVCYLQYDGNKSNYSIQILVMNRNFNIIFFQKSGQYFHLSFPATFRRPAKTTAPFFENYFAIIERSCCNVLHFLTHKIYKSAHVKKKEKIGSIGNNLFRKKSDAV